MWAEGDAQLFPQRLGSGHHVESLAEDLETVLVRLGYTLPESSIVFREEHCITSCVENSTARVGTNTDITPFLKVWSGMMSQLANALWSGLLTTLHRLTSRRHHLQVSKTGPLKSDVGPNTVGCGAAQDPHRTCACTIVAVRSSLHLEPKL